MSKLSYEDKINIYCQRKQGISLTNLSKKYNIRDNHIKYLIRLVDKHGLDSLRTTKNKKYSTHEKERIINRVLIDNEPVFSVAIDEGLSSDGLLFTWVKKYKENGYNIVERKRGRSPTMTRKPKKKETLEEENERLKKENEYLKAEIEYSKKLRAVVQARKNQQQKKK